MTDWSISTQSKKERGNVSDYTLQRRVSRKTISVKKKSKKWESMNQEVVKEVGHLTNGPRINFVH